MRTHSIGRYCLKTSKGWRDERTRPLYQTHSARNKTGSRINAKCQRTREYIKQRTEWLKTHLLYGETFKRDLHFWCSFVACCTLPPLDAHLLILIVFFFIPIGLELKSCCFPLCLATATQRYSSRLSSGKKNHWHCVIPYSIILIPNQRCNWTWTLIRSLSSAFILSILNSYERSVRKRIYYFIYNECQNVSILTP